MSSVSSKKATFSVFYGSSLTTCIFFKSGYVIFLLSVAGAAHVQDMQNQALGALLNQADGFELNLFAKEPFLV